MFNFTLGKKTTPTAGKPRAGKQRKSQARRQTRADKFNLQWKKQYSYVIAIMLGLAVVGMMMPEDDLMPIERIRISGEFRQLDTAAIEAQLKPFLGVGFFAVDIAGIQRSLQQKAWISEVSVRRVWPNELVVTVSEKQAFARWDEKHLLSTRGEVFEAESRSFAHLPLIHGYQGQSEELLRRFVMLRQRLLDHGIQLSELREDSKGSMALVLDGKLSVSFGSENSEHKIGQMLSVYAQQIRDRADHIRHIDFRYSNGFAISWKPEYLKANQDTTPRGAKNV